MQAYSPTAKERAMKMREVLLEALAGKMTWIQASEVLGLSPRTVRRWREKFDESGIGRSYVTPWVTRCGAGPPFKPCVRISRTRLTDEVSGQGLRVTPG